MVEMARAEERVRLVDQPFEAGEVFGREVEIFGLVRHRIQPHVFAHFPAFGIFAREDRRIDERFVIDRLPANGVILARLAIERGEDLPACGHLDRRFHRDPAHVMPGGIEAHLLPLQVEHFLRHGDPPLAAGDRRGVDELRGHCAGPLGQIDDQLVHVERIALPFEHLAAGGEADAADQVDRPARRVIAGQPFGEQQAQLAHVGGDRDGLRHAVHAARRVGRVDIQRDRPARPRRVGGQRGRVVQLRLLRRSVARGADVALRKGRGGQQEGEEGGAEGGMLHGRGSCGQSRARAIMYPAFVWPAFV